MGKSVTALFVYPVKSMAGYALSRTALTVTGFQHDRCWMVVDHNDRFITQRQHPELATIRPAVGPEGLDLTFPTGDAVHVPFVHDDNPATRRRVVIWGGIVAAVDQGDAIARHLTRFLGRQVRLVYVSERDPRQLGSSYPSPSGINVGFADSSPLHLVSQRSLDDLNTRLDVPVGIDRFRPNIVVGGVGPYEEDHWQTIRIGGIELIVVKDCIRCQMVNVDQQIGTKGIEPLETLGAYRAGPLGPRFGQKVVHTAFGTIALGDSVEVLGSET